MPLNFNIQKVLVAPLDWGLGHATRCIPIIRALATNGFTVLIAAEGAQAQLLQTEFPSLTILPLQGYRVRYSKSKWTLPFKLLAQLPHLIRTIQEETEWLDQTITNHGINLVISDNRYGLHSQKVSCIFITHQLTIKTPFNWLERLLQQLQYRYINRFTCCWVPDAAGDQNLAGMLSHPQKLPGIPVHYIGLLSRFQPVVAEKKYDYCILLSGPEPQRTLLEQAVIKIFANTKSPVLLVRGKPGSTEILTVRKNIAVKNHLPGDVLALALQQSDCIISRSGYTTVMELLSLQKKSILIPTPGQTEQEYLGHQLAAQHFCITIEQHRLTSEEQITAARNTQFTFPSFQLFNEPELTKLLSLSIR